MRAQREAWIANCTASSLSTVSPRAARGLFAAALVLVPALAGAQMRRPDPRAAIEVYADRTEYAPGEQARVAVRMLVEAGWHIQSHTPSFDYLIPTRLEIAPPPGFEVGVVEYPPHKMWQPGFQEEQLAVYEGENLLRTTVVAGDGAQSGAAAVTLHYQACDDLVCLPPTTAEAFVQLDVGEGGVAQHADVFAQLDAGSGNRPSPKRGLFATLLFGVLGGLILNAMPCVLPVLSLKVFGLLREAGSGRGAMRSGALATAAGIVASFLGLAGIAILARAGGQAVGWGIQFQNAGFVAFLVVVLLFFAFNMWGLFEIQVPSSVIGLGAKPRGGHAGHFAAGLFATLMATPCSAPFLGTAVGFALSQEAPTILAMFAAIGVGMALPYLLVAAFPSTVAWLPRPGPWMDTLKGIMGFLLAGTAVWLLYVLNAQISSVALALFEGALLLLGLCAWLRSRQTQHSGKARVGTVAMALCALLAVAIAARADARDSARPTASRLQWVPFDRAEAEQLARDGELVFVDVTADWCATCKVNERLVIETDEVVDLFARHAVIAMRADWTNRDDAIAHYLADYERYAIPFYVLYRPGAEPHVFGELLTRRSVVEAVEASAVLRAAGK